MKFYHSQLVLQFFHPFHTRKKMTISTFLVKISVQKIVIAVQWNKAKNNSWHEHSQIQKKLQRRHRSRLAVPKELNILLNFLAWKKNTYMYSNNFHLKNHWKKNHNSPQTIFCTIILTRKIDFVVCFHEQNKWKKYAKSTWWVTNSV